MQTIHFKYKDVDRLIAKKDRKRYVKHKKAGGAIIIVRESRLQDKEHIKDQEKHIQRVNYQEGTCYGLNCVFPGIYVEALTPNLTSLEIGPTTRQLRFNEVKRVGS